MDKENMILLLNAAEKALKELREGLFQAEKSVSDSSGSHAGNLVQLFPKKVESTFEASVGVAEVVAPSEMSGEELKILQDRLVQIIDENYEPLHDSIEKLGCRGNCYKCPHPEYPTVREQVKACLKEVVEGLDLDRGLISP